MHKGCSYTYPPLSIARYSFIQLSELEPCRVKTLAQGFNTAAQDLNPGSLSRESEALPLSLCALLCCVHFMFQFGVGDSEGSVCLWQVGIGRSMTKPFLVSEILSLSFVFMSPINSTFHQTSNRDCMLQLYMSLHM